jgi:hypothetical protein
MHPYIKYSSIEISGADKTTKLGGASRFRSQTAHKRLPEGAGGVKIHAALLMALTRFISMQFQTQVKTHYKQQASHI